MEQVHGSLVMNLLGILLVCSSFVIILLVILFTGSSSHIDNHKIIFLVLGEGPTYGINGSFASQEETFSINFMKPKTNFCLSLHYNGEAIIVTCLLMEKKSLSLKLIIKILIFWFSFVYEAYIMDLVLLSLEKYIQKEICMIFQLITMPLINLAY